MREAKQQYAEQRKASNDAGGLNPSSNKHVSRMPVFRDRVYGAVV
jgi:hypothetical protein